MLQHLLCFKLFAKKKPFISDVLFIAGMFAKTSFLIYLIVLIAVASSFVSVALTSKISISQLCCCCLGNGGFISKKLIFTSCRQKLQLWQGAKKFIFTACHSGKLKLTFTSPDIISTSPKSFLKSRIDLTVLLLFEFLKQHHLLVGQVKSRIH